jgi:hypothetical protein
LNGRNAIQIGGTETSNQIARASAANFGQINSGLCLCLREYSQTAEQEDGKKLVIEWSFHSCVVIEDDESNSMLSVGFVNSV